MTPHALKFFLTTLFVAAFCPVGVAEELPAAERFREHAEPILESYCYGCHGYGASEGGRTLDEFDSDQALVGDVGLWHAVLKNVRSGLMPPAEEERPSDEERQELFRWIYADVFGIDPADPDPGRVTLRRLNRVEYRNTIRDLMGVDYDTSDNFPPDDTGYGFDNIGDALSLSPLLMEKYMAAAEAIVTQAVPVVSKVVAESSVRGSTFRSEDGSASGREMSFYDAARVVGKIPIQQSAEYRIVVEARIDGYYEFDPGECLVTCEFDGQQRFSERYEWRDDHRLSFEFQEHLEAGEYPMSFELKPLVPEEKKLHFLNYRIERIRIVGPLDEATWVPPVNYARFFPGGPPPDSEPQRAAYAREVLAHFTRRAFRRPADDTALDRLVALAKAVYEQPDKNFEQGIAQAMIAVLSSPRFLFRIEEPGGLPPGKTHPWVDEYSLASRLSFFLWSTMPDDELLGLAERGQLREEFQTQVERMLDDRRSEALVRNFTGQWLQARDVETISVDAVAALGFQEEWEALLNKFRALRRGQRRERRRAERRQEQAEQSDAVANADSAADARRKAEEAEREKVFQEFRRLGALREKFSGDVRRAMRRETEMSFEYVMREDRSVLELIDSDYTFLNAKLAEHYGIPGVEGDKMRRVTLPEGSPRGGLLTQGTMLVVTSNPTRTSPVKRGLFVLDNVLGTPAPPPPEAVPPLEASAEAVDGHKPTLREALELHRSEPICAGCHARMDPLGLALENFNAIGGWRDTEHDQPIDTSGMLLTGEEFQDIRELKKVLKLQRRLDFYRCLTEKMLTYALGRGLQYYDESTVDRIVEDLDEHDGRFSVLMAGILESAPFQQQRLADGPAADRQVRHDPSTSDGEVLP